MKLAFVLLAATAVTISHAAKMANPKVFFAHAMFRHGERGALSSPPGDVLTEADWKQGGGGYGEITTTGMRQHFLLGKALGVRYRTTIANFVDKRYAESQVYLFATDKPRTLASAQAHFSGFYLGADSTVNVDYPTQTGWPATYVPIPIRSALTSDDTYHIGDDNCARLSEAHSLAQTQDEYTTWINDRTKKPVQFIAAQTKTDNLALNDAIRLHQNIQLEKTQNLLTGDKANAYNWYTDDVSEDMTQVKAQSDRFDMGIYESKPMTNNVDLALEIKKLQSGPIIKRIANEAKEIYSCVPLTTDPKSATVGTCSDGSAYRTRRYYAVSAHDTTINQYLTALEVQQRVIDTQPHFAATILTEFYSDGKPVAGNTDNVYFRVLYQDGPLTNADLSEFAPRDITAFIVGCDYDADCPLKVYTDLVTKYDAGDHTKACATKIQP